ncbi:hypothetical protein PAMA_002019 [Pampus argenteus]
MNPAAAKTDGRVDLVPSDRDVANTHVNQKLQEDNQELRDLCCLCQPSLSNLDPRGLQGHSPDQHGNSPTRLPCDSHPKPCSSGQASPGCGQSMAKSSPELSQRHWPVDSGGAGCESPEAKHAAMGTPEHLRKGQVIVGSPESIRHHHHYHHSPGVEHGKGRYSSVSPGRDGDQRRAAGEKMAPHHQSLYNGRHMITLILYVNS